MMHPCDLMRDQLAAYEDGQLMPDEITEVVQHLKTCAVCRNEATAQSLMRTRLRRYREIMEPAPPPEALLNRARVQWAESDVRKQRRIGLRLALSALSLLAFSFGVAWAKWSAQGEFPIAFAFQNYLKAKYNPPAFSTPDADAAATWLRVRLGRELPPVNLSLSRATLLGADVLKTQNGMLGKLIYLTPQGRIALFIAPNKTRFTDTRPTELLERSFAVKTVRKTDFYGWSENGIGYGLITSQPSHEGILLNAKRATENR